MKKLFLFLFILFAGIFIYAKPVSFEYARIIAEKWYKHYNGNHTNDFTIKDATETKYDGITTYYTFVFNSGGFVMIAADDASVPILGYSAESIFDKNNIPPNAKAWFESYSKEIKYIIEKNISNSKTLSGWQKIANGSFNKNTKAVSPLCTTVWDQSDPFNLLCPGGSVTGCVATAMAQIMKKWEHPVTGQGSHSYNHPNYGTLSANFGATTYQWSNMIDNYFFGGTPTEENAVATLMYHCGVSVNMYYSPSGSGAYTENVPGALINYFVYQPIAEVKYKEYFSSSSWITLLKEELDAGRPVFYSGYDNTFGHAFVCDGYNTSSQFHFNWGWTGYSDGYYTMGNLNPASYNFDTYNTIVVRIRPLSNLVPIANFSASTTTPAIGNPVTFTDLSSNNPTSWLWTFEGGTPSSYNGQTPPDVTFSTNGYHLVSLKVSNANGSDIMTREHYIDVGGTPSAWIKQNSGFPTPSRGIDQIFIVNPYVVWATAYDGVTPANYIREFTRTVNGGLSWTPDTIDFTGASSYGLSNIFAFSATEAYACMFPLSGTGGKIVKTTDGGVIWTEQTTAPFTGSWANFVHFFNANDGVSQGDPVSNEFVIYTTTNGGTNWTQVPGANIPNAQSGEFGIVNYYDAVGNIIWFSTNKGRVFKSVDKGLNWTVSSTGLNDYTYIVFKDANIGFAILASTTPPVSLKKTNDGGLTWTTLTPTGAFVQSHHLDYVPGTASMWVNISPNCITLNAKASTIIKINNGVKAYSKFIITVYVIV